jgi:hypothetical protein
VVLGYHGVERLALRIDRQHLNALLHPARINEHEPTTSTSTRVVEAL